ncbi:MULTISPECIES: response regulator transcription factor [Amycolatopsis]|uniref:Sensory transduction protein RegX3 n=2 Tax=Amycolatopsis TaxID=1813 RepID=A0A1I3XL52_9PSEU|nr:response regulator transcription factor [Amycolatopsis sacchari]SFK19771.1 DNA-binding response regulator, OmpR family, contains REC and winged-helix (wHTH) domain [Amycolatopsis sacchari]
MRFLLVEDDGRVATAVRSALHRRGVDVEWAATGLEAKAKYPQADVVLLDLGLPDMDGIELCEAIRRGSDAAIIVVSARGQVDDRITGLRAGADDYLVKPFHVDELLARAQAVLRRRAAPPPAPRPRPLHAGDLRIDPARFEVSAQGKPIALSRKEFLLLYTIAAAAGDVCTRQSLITEIWGEPWPGANRTLDVHVATLRTKLDRPGLIETVRGVGYRLGRPAG